jgi:uncharacterized protein YfdQ (DUF2303 family)
MSETTPDAQVIVDTATAAVKPTELNPETVYAVVVTEGSRVEVIDQEKHLPEPKRKQGRFRFFDAPSVVTYVNRHKSAATTLFMSDAPYQVVAVLNGHSEDFPGWGDHRAILEVRQTDAWKRWLNYNEKLVEQHDFAEHIERNIVDITSPPGADMLELAQTFQATTKAEFKQARQLANGERQFQFVEEVNASGGRNGQLTIPKEFTLGIAPFEGADPYKVTARLRYQLREGHLRIGYVLDNPKDVEREAFIGIAQEVATGTELTALYGVSA